MTTPSDPKQDQRTGQSPQQPSANASADMQGEGNYDAARRHRSSTERFIEQGKVEQAAKDAAPDSPAEAQDLKAAEQAGRRHAKG